MMRKTSVVVRIACCLGLVAGALMAGSSPAFADSEIDVPPVLLPDSQITDLQEAGDLPPLPPLPGAPGVSPSAASSSASCSYESVLTGPNATPAEPSIQHVYFLPSDTTAAETMDRPRSCSDGTVKASAVGNSSRNLTVWQHARGAGLHFRVIKQTYTHNYNGSKYATRAVRRFRSGNSAAWWNQRTLSQRLAAVRDQMIQNGWNKSNTKYIAVLHSAAEPYSCGANTCYRIGRAERNGAYAFSVRYFAASGNTSYSAIRYGCATSGDVFQGHETTHLLGAGHVTDNKYDLMHSPITSERTFRNTNPPLYWDYNRDSYHNTVKSSPYVISGGLAGSVTTC